MKKSNLIPSLVLLTLLALPTAAKAGVLDDEYNGGPTSAAGGGSSEIAPQPCDPRYWETMSARAWMEAEREIMQNQNLIFKPDSVMEYTCFDSMVSHAAHYLGDIFVHTKYFGKMIIERGSAQSQEIALKNVVYTSLKTYLNENFNNAFFSKRAPELENKPSITNMGNAVVVPSAGGSYGTCKVMYEVWKAAKCMNFREAAFETTDGFYPFTTIKALPGKGTDMRGYDDDAISDVRKWPEECASPVKGQVWTEQNKIATNESDNKYPFREPLKDNFEKVRKMVEPGQCGTAIKTGVKVILSGSGGGTDDAVCTNPGCTYVGGKCQ